MATRSKIEWTETTWNPVTGCSKISPGCKHCLSPDTRILMADMSLRALGEVEVGDEVVSFTEEPSVGQNRTYSVGTVEAKWSVVKPAVRIVCGGHTVVASEDHPFLTYTRPQWKPAGRLNLSSGIVAIGLPPRTPDVESNDYLAGYACGAIEGDGTFRWQPGQRSDKLGYPQAYCRVAVLEEDQPILDRIARAYAAHEIASPPIRPFDSGRTSARQMVALETRALASIEAIEGNILQHQDSFPYKMGWLAGFFDTDGCYSGKNLRFSQKNTDPLLRAQRYAAEMGFELKIEDHRNGRHACHAAILLGTLEDRLHFLSTIRPALLRKCGDFVGRRFSRKWQRVDGVTRIGPQELIDIQVDTRTFIAEGLATHNCYAERMALRLQAMGQHRYRNGFAVTLQPEALEEPLRWRKPRVVFVNSMSDLFHEDVPESFIVAVFRTMEQASWHVFQVLTKRSDRLRDMANRLPWPENVWMGVSVESADFVHRIDDLLHVPASVRFLSVEPLLGPIPDLPLEGIHWVIVGGESGPGARPMEAGWVKDIRSACGRARVPFFFKQWGGVNKKKAGRELDGRTWNAMPARRYASPAVT